MAKVVVQNVVFLGILCALLFLPAGTLAWPQAWVFLVLFFGCSAILGLWLRNVDPGLLAERMKSPLRADQTSRDRAVMGLIMIGFAGWFVVMGLDARRFGWSHVPLWVEALGALLVVITFFGWAGVLRANSFAGTRIRLQPERGHVVIDKGPYAVVRHPMYAWVPGLTVGTSLLLGSLWGLVSLIPITLLLAVRILGEEAQLIDGLPGYRDYATRVRFRLMPGVW